MKELQYTAYLLQKKQTALNTSLVEEAAAALKNNEATKEKFEELRKELKDITEMLSKIIKQINIQQKPSNDSFNLKFMKWTETDMDDVSINITKEYSEMLEADKLRLFNNDEAFFKLIQDKYGSPPPHPPNNPIIEPSQTDIVINNGNELSDKLNKNISNRPIIQPNRVPDITNVTNVEKKSN